MLLDALRHQIPGYDPVKTAGDCVFDDKAAQLALDFFPTCLHHVEGGLTGKPFVLELWEQAIVANIFGWYRPDGTRRYREVFIYVARKNGKTPLVAGIALYVLFCDDELGQQNICAAGDSQQAAILFRHAAGMVRLEPELDCDATVYGEKEGSIRKTIAIDATNSYLRVVSAEAKGKHGGNLHLGIIDELHTQDTRNLVDTIETSLASANRKHPLLIEITTADFWRESICNEKLDYAEKILDGRIKNNTFLPVIFRADVDDDWKDPKIWAKANPNLGVSVSLDYLQRKCQEAQDRPSFENTFKRLNLNIVTEQSVRWLQMEAWDACGDKPDLSQLKTKPCWAGLDLSSKSDLTPFALVFRPDEDCDKYRALLWCWVPGESMEKRYRQDGAPYPTWVRQGFVEKTEGNVVDYDHIRAKINEIALDYSIQEIAFDPWNATQTASDLGEKDGFEMVEFRQGFKSMNEPSKELERLVLSRQLAHGGNPVLWWAASNVSVKTDPAGNIKPDKQKSTEKIDPIVALIMALGRAMVGVEQKTGSIYDKQGIEWV